MHSAETESVVIVT